MKKESAKGVKDASLRGWSTCKVLLNALKWIAVTIFGGERRESLETGQNDRLCLHLFSAFYCNHGKVHLLLSFF